MKNKELQEQRMRGYFLQATREMLKAEGLKSLSVRSIADKAGYSYATLYSYFKDINDLVFLCVDDFFEECSLYVKSRVKTKKQEKGLPGLKTAIRAYADFFVQYPGIFELFFIEKIGDLKGKRSITGTIHFSLDRVCEEEWNYCISRNLLPAEQVEPLKGQIRCMVYGLLLQYLNRRMPPSYTEFVNQLTTQLDALLSLYSTTHNTAVTHAGHVQADPAGNTSIHNSLISIKVGNHR